VKVKPARKKKVDGGERRPEVSVEDEFFEKEKHYNELSSFHQMNLSRPLLKAVASVNFVTPTPIQAATIPVALVGRDVCGCAATGTGKTAAYMLPVLERLLFKPTASPLTRVLVLVPTRELGIQVFQVAKQLAQFTRIQMGLSVGGLDIKAQEASLRSNPDIVIATPGRLIDHIHNTPSFHLEDIELLILDEADRMLDEHFAEQLKEIVKECSPARQTMLFSATMTESVQDLAAISLKKPVKIFIDSNQTVAANLRQEFIKIRKSQEEDREAVVAALVTRTFQDHVIVFLQTKKAAHRLHVTLRLLGVKAGELHGDMSQMERLNALRKFKEEEYDVLLATDVAARGLDIQGVKTVINVELPNSLQHYIHRVGRTARAGRVGRSVSLVGEKERKLFKEIVKVAVNPVKSRSIPAEVIAKFKEEMERMKPEVDSLLDDEAVESELKKADNAALRADQVILTMQSSSFTQLLD
jgi:ATP-dependent RNA helicase DDX27